MRVVRASASACALRLTQAISTTHYTCQLMPSYLFAVKIVFWNLLPKAVNANRTREWGMNRVRLRSPRSKWPFSRPISDRQPAERTETDLDPPIRSPHLNQVSQWSVQTQGKACQLTLTAGII